ncbi:hypothetical protein ACU635_51065 [[Actinomadura] parvosata]|uniref:hypothetical protein n=1 Tax=[Actinomadura] parvosata TaxID=1955412 RepID=UPI00406D180A
MTYQPGELIDITIEDATVLDADENGMQVEYQTSDGHAVRCAIPFGKHVHVKRLVPADGPPKAGELWEDAHGVRYLAIEYGGGIRLHSGAPGGTGYEAAYVHHNHGPIKRVLAARDDELSSEEITPTIAHHVLWHYGEPGMEPGSFTKDLIALIARADPHNRRRLAAEYPGYVAACNWAEATDSGIADLRQIAERAS